MEIIRGDNVLWAPVRHASDATKQVLFRQQNNEGHIQMIQFAIFPPGTIADRHHHATMTEIFLVLPGANLWVEVEDAGYELKPGDAIRIDAGEVHTQENRDRLRNLELLCIGLAWEAQAKS